MAQTPVLQLQNTQLADGDPRSYPFKLDFDTNLFGAHTALDLHAGNMTGSCYTLFTLGSGTISPAGSVGKDIGAEYTRTNRVLQEVVAFATNSGSGGVTRIDVQVQDSGGTFNSIFSNNAFKPALSSSLGNYGVAKSATFLTSSWGAGKIIKASLDTAAGDATAANAQTGLTVMVFWKPSGSYGA